ncbi:putative reverse transcriptase domain-containing protein [Tanacetum coccineum]
MLESGQWFIRNHPLILKKWNPDVNLLKEDVRNISVCVKLHGVPITAFSEDGFSSFTTKLDTIVVAMPKLTGEGFDTCTIHVKYESLLDVHVVWFLVILRRSVLRIQHTANSSGNKKNAMEPTKEVDYPGDHDSEDEVESVDNDMARSMASERVGFGTQSLLEQWRDSYENGDYDEDPYC